MGCPERVTEGSCQGSGSSHHSSGMAIVLCLVEHWQWPLLYTIALGGVGSNGGRGWKQPVYGTAHHTEAKLSMGESDWLR